MLAGCIAFIAGAAILGILHHSWRDRLLAPAPLVMLTASILMNPDFLVGIGLSPRPQTGSAPRRAPYERGIDRRIALALGRCCGATGMMAGFLSAIQW